MSAHWEYKVLTYDLKWKGFDYDQIEKDLNELGRRGWEAFTTLAPGIGAGHVNEITVMLKRSTA